MANNPALPGYTAVGYKAARSFHSDGVNLLLADGSVHFIRDSVDPVTWRSMSTRNGGEVFTANY